MTILFKLNSDSFTKEQSEYLYINMVEVKWHILMFPREGEIIDCESIFEGSVFESIIAKFKDINLDLSWFVDSVHYKKINGVLTPIIWLNGD